MRDYDPDFHGFQNQIFIKWQKDLDNAILGEIKRKAIENGIKTEYVLNEKAIISALKKQIPQKVNISLKGTTGWNTKCHCPNCRAFVSNGKYCCECGQALDWGDTK